MQCRGYNITCSPFTPCIPGSPLIPVSPICPGKPLAPGRPVLPRLPLLPYSTLTIIFIQNKPQQIFWFLWTCKWNIEHSNKISFFIGYINNIATKFPIYYALHMCIVWQIVAIKLEWFHVFIKDRCPIKMLMMFLYIFSFLEKY